MDVRVVSFGFKYGLPLEADLVFDVRFLPNPYYIPELKHQTGLDEPVRNFVFKYQQTLDFVAKVEDLLSLPAAQLSRRGKNRSRDRRRLHRRQAPERLHRKGAV